jgi:CrcB protein
MNLSHALAVFIGGGAGSLVRWLLGGWISRFSSSLPLGTLAANILATAVLAYILIKSEDKTSSNFLLLTVGFCGGFSTFSTFSVDTYKLFENGNTLFAVLNVLISVIACLIVAWAAHHYFNENI